MKTLQVLTAIALIAVGMTGAVADDIQPGLWRITLESRVAATPDWNPEPFQLIQCLTKQDAQQPERLLASWGAAGASGCEFANRQASDQHLNFDLHCGGNLKIEGHGEVDFTATRLEGFLNVHFAASEDGAEPVDMQNRLQAVYLGTCPPGGESP
jgi:hypothetical protein